MILFHNCDNHFWPIVSDPVVLRSTHTVKDDKQNAPLCIKTTLMPASSEPVILRLICLWFKPMFVAILNYFAGHQLQRCFLCQSVYNQYVNCEWLRTSEIALRETFWCQRLLLILYSKDQVFVCIVSAHVYIGVSEWHALCFFIFTGFISDFQGLIRHYRPELLERIEQFKQKQQKSATAWYRVVR